MILLLLPLLLKFCSLDTLAAVVTVVVVIVLLFSNLISKLDAVVVFAAVAEFDCLLLWLDDDIFADLRADSNCSIFFVLFDNLLLVLFIYFLYDS